ncbi:MAG: rod shape-determining protein MreC, partial [Desulfomicrobium sp.]|nr:rod shape-determining protein MreC [Desulfomicrobium sp.]
MSPRFKRLVLFFFLPLFVYFSMYTWNWKTGHLDRLAALTGLELTGWVLAPGRWLQSNVDEFWSRYVYLVGVRQENEDLVLRVRELEQELGRVSEKAKSVDRLNALLRFSPEPPWEMRGGRVIGQKLGPNAILETLLIDVGSRHGVRVNDPVISPRGVVGRIAKPGIHFSSVVLLSDPSSRIPVITSEGRVPAIVQGQGPGAFLEVKFIPRNDPVSPG